MRLHDVRWGVRAATSAVVAGAALVLVPAGAQAAAVNVAVWHMDDAGATMSDASGRQHTGSLKNVDVRQPGASGTAFGFKTKRSVVTVPSAGDLNPGTATFSVSLKVRFDARPTAAVGDYDLLRKGLSSTSGGSYKVEILRSGRAYCNFGGTKTVAISGGPDLADGGWHSISCTRTSTSVTLNVDGASFVRQGWTGKIAYNATLLMGAKSTCGGDQ